MPPVTVSFDMMGHGEPLAKMTIPYGSSLKRATCVAEDVKDELGDTVWQFDNWYTERYTDSSFNKTRAAFNYNGPVTFDITLYAKWDFVGDVNDVSTVKVQVDKCNGKDTGIESYTVQVKNGDKLSLPNFAVVDGSDDYVINEWVGTYYDSLTQKIEWIGEAPSLITLTGSWIKAFTVMFDMRGKGEQIAPEKVKNGGTVRAPKEPEVKDYGIEGWYENSNFTGSPWNFESGIITKNTTLYAKWGAAYTITFDLQNMGSFPAGVKLEEVDEFVRKTKVTKIMNIQALGMQVINDVKIEDEDYVFAGWYTSSTGGTKFETSTNFSKSITLYARWEGMVTLTYKLDKARSGITLPQSQRVKWGTEITIPSLPDDGVYAFAMWEDDWTTGVWYKDDTMTVQRDTTLVSVYMNPVSVKFYQTKKSDGSESVSLLSNYTREIKYGTSLKNYDIPSRSDVTGWKFAGWYNTNASSGGSQITTSTKFYNDTNVYERWDEKWHEVTVYNNEEVKWRTLYVRNGDYLINAKFSPKSNSSDHYDSIFSLATYYDLHTTMLVNGLCQYKNSETSFCDPRWYKITKDQKLYLLFTKLEDLLAKPSTATNHSCYFDTLRNIDRKYDENDPASMWQLLWAEEKDIDSSYTYIGNLGKNSYYEIAIYQWKTTVFYYYCIKRNPDYSKDVYNNVSYTDINDYYNRIRIVVPKLQNTYRGLFQNLKNLSKIDLSGFDFRNMENAENMFNGCSKLYSIENKKGLNFTVLYADYMFANCGLTSLDLTSSNRMTLVYTGDDQYKKLISCSYMFYRSKDLWTIYVSSVSNFAVYGDYDKHMDWSKYLRNNVASVSEFMFDGCESLYSESGGANDSYSAASKKGKKMNIERAHIGNNDYGFFSSK